MSVSTQTLLEALFSQRLGYTVQAGEVVQAPVDFVMGHDATLALLVDDFVRLGCRVWDPSRVLITCDHFAPPARIDWADLQKHVLQFARRHELPIDLYQGICHQRVLEDRRAQPGTIIVGADSHTTLAGAVGAFATGLGATDILACLARGATWFRVPESRRIRFTGARQPWVMGRDLALALLGMYGEEGLLYQALEFFDGTEDGLPMDSRAAICCMVPEMGAKAALFAPDAVTRAYLETRDGTLPEIPWDADAVGAEPFEVAYVDSLVARPHSPAAVAPVPACQDVVLDEIYIGSCAGGRLEDLEMASRVLRGRRVAPGVKVIAVPSSVRVFQQAIDAGYIQALLAAGVCVSNPSCGACGGIDKGVLATGDVALTTSTRNFRGRLGARESAVYLASTATCAASALTGRITHPQEVWEA